jgi:protoheme IX farnesyltransferase
MPVLIGWAAVTDSLAWAPVILFGVVFFWTPPHFWALAIRYREDYQRAGVPMLPVVASPTRVATEIVVYSWLTVAATLALWPVATGWVYGGLAAVAGAVLLVAAHRLLAKTRAGLDGKPMRLFHLSNSYLAFIFVAVAVDTFVLH